MEETPPISCLCCTHGRPQLLEEAIESFLRQDYTGPKELVILNDQPEQELVFEHPQVRVINIKKSFRSLGEKRNACAALCSHDWLFVWDDDDIYLPWRISWSMQMVDARRRFFKADSSLILSDGMLWGPERNLLHSSACFRRDLFDGVGGYPHMGTGEDLEFENRIAQMLQVPSLESAGDPGEKLYYIYRWGRTGSYHGGWFDAASSHFRILDHVRKALRPGQLPRGRIILKPNWKTDYVAMVARHLGTSQAKMPASAAKAPRAGGGPARSGLSGVLGRVATQLRSAGSGQWASQWLVHCADPLGPLTLAPQRPPSPREAQDLVVQADMHGVLPGLLRRFPHFSDETFAEAKAEAMARHRSALAYSLMLRTHADAIVAAAKGLPVAVVKGPVFSRALYPEPGLRTFTDLDLLIDPSAEPELARVLDQAGFAPGTYDQDPNRQEWKWHHRDNEALMIEVHTNMVHHPHLRAAMSMTFADLSGIAETPAALLGIAALHGALHRFERLRHVVDICQAARRVGTSEEESRFEQLIARTRTRFAATVGLDLAYRLFGEPRCRELARELGPSRHVALSRLLLGRSVIASTMGGNRFMGSWRRQAFRILLKRSKTV